MLNIKIDEEGLEKNKISFEDYLVLLCIYKKINISESVKNLYDKNLIMSNTNNLENFEDYEITFNGGGIIDDVILDSCVKVDIDPLENLAKKLKEIFPKGKKEGTNMYWSEGTALIIRRLKLFFKKYGQYSNEDIINAAERYINSFNGDYRYMRTLKYFIFKEEKSIDNSSSELLTLIENKDQIDETIDNNWTQTLI